MNQTKQFEAKRLQGFNDYFAEDVRIREYVKNIFRSTYQKYGFEPLETPALEYSELMLGQSGEEAEKQYYRFKDNGDRDVMLKFEVMISMCRAVSQNFNNIIFPYKRFQIQNVWRAEKVQKGRYREFTQIDADILGSTSMNSDSEIIQMGIEVASKLGFKDFIARISNRKFLEGLAQYNSITLDKYYDFFMSIDKLEKNGKDFVINELIKKRNIEPSKATKSIDMLLESCTIDDFQEQLSFFKENVGKTTIGKEGLQELSEIFQYLEVSNINKKYYKFDPTIARGLASYTGPVWEFTVIDGGVGSIAGGGRYDSAIAKYIGRAIPATGMSFGLERISDIIKDRNMIDFQNETKVLVTIFSNDTANQSIIISNKLRDNNIATTLYTQNIKLDKQFKYADRKKIPYVIVIGPDEIKKDTLVLKDMAKRTQEELTFEQLIKRIT